MYLLNDIKNNCNTKCCMHYQFTLPSAQDTKTYHFQVKIQWFLLEITPLEAVSTSSLSIFWRFKVFCY